MFPELELREGWTTVFLLLLMLLLVGWSIQAANWVDGLAILQSVVLVGGATGIVLAKSRAPAWMLHLLSAMAGLSWGSLLTATVLAEVLELSGTAAIMELEWRLEVWLVALFSGETSSGTFIFLLLLCLLLWAISYFAAWTVFRWQRAWWAVIACSVAVLINMTYARPNLTPHLLAFLLVALLLVVRTSVATYEQEWRRGRVAYGSELTGIFLRAGLAVSVLSIFLAWATPEALASGKLQEFWQKVGEPWRRLQEESSRIFQGLNYQNEPQIIPIARSMKFGGPVSLTDDPVMEIRAGAGRYWRNRLFHEYTGDGWNDTDVDVLVLGPNDRSLAVPPFSQRRVVAQTVTLQRPLLDGDTLVAASQPVYTDLAVRAAVSYVVLGGGRDEGRDKEVLYAAPGDPSLLYPLQPLEAGATYRVTSTISLANEDQLRRAGAEYPAWVVPRYLQLPPSLPERVGRLAQQVTAGRETPYDKAIAIQDYLRDIPYNDQFAGVPPGRDGVDYFLFDSREGYCTYYASAMVVMLRSVGVPARYAEGYSQAASQGGVYRILAWDAHGWPEVFFPNYGWVEFEPTASEAVIDRAPPPSSGGMGGSPHRPAVIPEMEERELPFDRGDDPGELTVTPPIWQRIGPWGWAALGVVICAIAVGAALAVRRRRLTEGLSVAERVYEDLVQWTRRLFRLGALGHQTPYEYVGAVATAVPKAESAVRQIAEFYVRERFGGKQISSDEAEQAWSRAKPLLLVRWLDRKAERLRRVWR